MGEDILDRVPPPADRRLKYGPGELQFGDLRVPHLPAEQRAPLVMFVHGGWWKAAYGLDYGGHLCAALKTAGIATWSIEYRRVGDAGGGWPGVPAGGSKSCSRCASAVNSAIVLSAASRRPEKCPALRPT